MRYPLLHVLFLLWETGGKQSVCVCVHLLSAAAVQTHPPCRVVHEARARDPTWSRRAQVSHAGPPRLQLAAVDVFSRLWVSVVRSVPHSGF